MFVLSVMMQCIGIKALMKVDIEKLEKRYRYNLMKIIGWKNEDCRSYVEVYARCGVLSMETLVMIERIKWVLNTNRMSKFRNGRILLRDRSTVQFIKGNISITYQNLNKYIVKYSMDSFIYIVLLMDLKKFKIITHEEWSFYMYGSTLEQASANILLDKVTSLEQIKKAAQDYEDEKNRIYFEGKEQRDSNDPERKDKEKAKVAYQTAIKYFE